MATIIAPNREYTGNQGVIGFVNGVAPFVNIEDKELEARTLALLESKGFTIMDDEEYASTLSGAFKEAAKSETVTVPILTGNDLLPPVEGVEVDGGMDGDTDTVEDESDETTTTGDAKSVIKRNKKKAPTK